LFLYQNERDGANIVNTPLRSSSCTGSCTTFAGPGHLNDASAKVYVTPNVNDNGRFSGDLTAATLNGTQPVINGEGGWWDAGDYMKFVMTHSYTVGVMLALEFCVVGRRGIRNVAIREPTLAPTAVLSQVAAKLNNGFVLPPLAAFSGVLRGTSQVLASGARGY
jgi:glycosyl hydrolase family 9